MFSAFGFLGRRSCPRAARFWVLFQYRKSNKRVSSFRNHLEDMRKCFRDPLNSSSFDNVTHGLGLGMLDAALDMVITVIEQQIRILSGAAASDQADPAASTRRIRRRQRKASPTEGERSHRANAGVSGQAEGFSKLKARSKSRKKAQQEGPAEPHADPDQLAGVDSNVLTLVSLGYEAVSGSV